MKFLQTKVEGEVFGQQLAAWVEREGSMDERVAFWRLVRHVLSTQPSAGQPGPNDPCWSKLIAGPQDRQPSDAGFIQALDARMPADLKNRLQSILAANRERLN